MNLLEGRIAIVTGAGGGLGRAHALALAAEGAKLLVNDPGVLRDGSGGTGANMADTVVAEIRRAGGQAVANYDSVADAGDKIVRAAKDAFGRVDILVNNAGILRDKTILNMTDDMWDLVLAVHLRGTFLCTRAAARLMKEQGQGGRIINTTSVAGLKGNFGQSNYSAAKAGIYGFTMTASMELQKEGITVNAIAPIAKTRMTEEIDSVPPEYRPEEVSPVVVFLASDLSKDLTGRILGVHGRHLFEYRMEVSEGREKKEAWTPAEINSCIRTPETPKGGSGAPAGGTGKVAGIFKALPGAFDPEKSAGWDALIHFAIAGSGDWTVEVKNKTVQVSEGKPEAPTSVITTDTDTLVGMVEGRIKGDMAFMSGKLKATKVPDLGKFGKAFDFKKIKLDGAGPAAPAGGGGNPVAEIFRALPGAFDPEKSAGWDTLIHFVVTGSGDWTVEVKDKTVKVSQGKPASAGSVITTDADTLIGMVEGRIKGDMAFMSGKLKATKVPDLGKFGKAFDFKKIKIGTPAAPASVASPGPVDLGSLLSRLQARFLPDKATGFNATLLFKVDGQAGTLEIKDRAATVKPAVPLATCTLTTDGATLSGIVDGSIDGQKAFSEGKIKITHLPSWLKFRQMFSFAPEKGLHRSLIGKRTGGAAQLIRPEKLAAYDAAVGDEGSIIFPVTLVKDPFVKLFEDPDFNGELSRMVHGEQVFVFHRPLKAWDLITPRGRVLGIEDKSSGQILNFGQRIYCEGELVVEMESRLFFRGESKGEKAPAAPPPAKPPPTSSSVVTVAADLPRRYAEASGDMNPIHVEKSFAQSAGFKDVILHGLGTLALVAKTFPQRPKRLQVRFAKPVYPGDTLTTSFWKKDDRIEFETLNASGEAVLSQGIVDL